MGGWIFLEVPFCRIGLGKFEILTPFFSKPCEFIKSFVAIRVGGILKKLRFYRELQRFAGLCGDMRFHPESYNT